MLKGAGWHPASQRPSVAFTDELRSERRVLCPLGVRTSAQSGSFKIHGNTAWWQAAWAWGFVGNVCCNKTAEKRDMPWGLQKSPEWFTRKKKERVRDPGHQKRRLNQCDFTECLDGSVWDQCVESTTL